MLSTICPGASFPFYLSVRQCSLPLLRVHSLVLHHLGTRICYLPLCLVHPSFSTTAYVLNHLTPTSFVLYHLILYIPLTPQYVPSPYPVRRFTSVFCTCFPSHPRSLVVTTHLVLYGWSGTSLCSCPRSFSICHPANHRILPIIVLCWLPFPSLYCYSSSQTFESGAMS